MSAELEDIHEECGIFGVWGHPDASRLTYFGLHALQHRGQEGAGIVSNDNGHLIGHRGLGLLTQVFGDEREIERLKGNCAIGTCVTQRPARAPQTTSSRSSSASMTRRGSVP